MWVKGPSGLVNLERANDIAVRTSRDGKAGRVVAIFRFDPGGTSDETDLFVGTVDECDKYMERLYPFLAPEAELWDEIRSVLDRVSVMPDYGDGRIYDIILVSRHLLEKILRKRT